MTDIRYITVDSEWRTMTIPSGEEVLGVYNDRDVEIKYFKVPRYYEEVDLADFTAKVNFRPPGGTVDSSYAENVQADSEYITFQWTVPHKVCSAIGTALVQLCFILLDGTEVVKEYNTTYWGGKVLPGIEPDGSVIPDDPAIVTSLEVLAAQAQQAASDAEASAEQVRTTGILISSVIYMGSSDPLLTGGKYFDGETSPEGSTVAESVQLVNLDSNLCVPNIFLPEASGTRKGIAALRAGNRCVNIIGEATYIVPTVTEYNGTVLNPIDDRFLPTITNAQIDALFNE